MKIGYMLFLFSAILLVSCNGDNITDCDYSDCYTEKPSEGKVNLRVSIEGSNQHVPVIIYEGRITENHPVIYDTLDSTRANYILPVDKYYSAIAKYTEDGNIYFAVDGDRLKVKSRVECDSTCYKVKEIDLDLRLKN